MGTRLAGSFFISVAVIVIATATLIVGPARSVALSSSRVVATPVPTPTATARVLAAAAAPAPECPQMNNPGGLAWRPSADAGPWATGATVELPTLGVKAPVVRVGVGLDKMMVVPKTAHEIAWLDQGQFPGSTNNAVLAGHVGYSRRAGSFARVGQLRPGDLIHVNIDGKRFTFKVVWNCSFGRHSPAADKVMGYTETPSVTLITCGGGWDAAARTHTNRTAVRAELVETVDSA